MRNLLLIFLLLPLFLQGQMLPSGYGRKVIDPSTLDSVFYRFRSVVGVTESGGAVSAWADQSGLSHDVTQSTEANKPTYHSSGGPNNVAYISADGTNDYLRSASHWFGEDELTFFAVVRWKGTDANTGYSFCRYQFASGVSGRQFMFYENATGQWGTSISADGATPLYSNYGGGNNEWSIVSFRLNTSNRQMSSNGKIGFSDASSTILNYTTTLTIGATSNPTADGFSDIDMVEFILVTEALDDETMHGVEAWLSKEYNIPLESAVKPIEINPEKYTIRDPSQVKNLIAWYSPESIYRVGGATTGNVRVDAWIDRVTTDTYGNNIWRQGNSAAQPYAQTDSLNGYDVLRFTSVEYMTQGVNVGETAIQDLAEFTFIIVARPKDRVPSRNSMLLASANVYNDGGTYISMCDWTTGSASIGLSSFGNLTSRYHWFAPTGWIPGGLSASLTESDKWYIFAVSGKKSSTLSQPYHLGQYRSNADALYRYVGDVAEILIFDKIIDTRLMMGIMRGLGEKYNLPID